MPATQRILHDVPRIGFGQRPDKTYHFCPLPGALHAALTYLNDPPSYDLLMAVSGAAFRTVWEKDDGGNVDLMYLAPTPHERIFDALGYDYATVDGHDESAMRAAIIQSIDAGRPVVAFGIIGPPEAGLVTGYEQGGDILHGWSYFDHQPPDACYRLEHWFQAIQHKVPIGAIVIGQKRGARPSQRATAVATLRWAIDLARTAHRPRLPRHLFGSAAYNAWAAALLVDADYPAADPNIMAHRMMLYDDQLMMLSERGHAANYLRELAQAFPDASEPLKKASAFYKESGDRAKPLSQTRKQIADPAIRRAAIEHIRAARDAEIRGVEQLELALETLSRPPAEAQLTLSPLTRRDSALRQTPENVPIPAVLRGALDVTGDDFGHRVFPAGDHSWEQSNAYLLMGLTTGDWFENAWFARDGSTAPSQIANTSSESWCHALAAAGYEARVLARSAANFNPADLRPLLAHSIGVRGLPVIVVGLPTDDHVLLVTAYDRAGDRITGWAATGGRTIRFEPTERLQIEDWPSKVTAIIALTQRITRPDLRTVFPPALRRGVERLRARQLGPFHSGPATYDAWAKALLDDSPAPDAQALHERRASAIEPLIWDLAERRAWAQNCLNDAAMLFPDQAGPLKAAADACKQIHDHMWEINALAGGRAPGDREFPSLADPAARALIASVIGVCRDLDVAIASHLENALSAMK